MYSPVIPATLLSIFIGQYWAGTVKVLAVIRMIIIARECSQDPPRTEMACADEEVSGLQGTLHFVCGEAGEQYTTAYALRFLRSVESVEWVARWKQKGLQETQVNQSRRHDGAACRTFIPCFPSPLPHFDTY